MNGVASRKKSSDNRCVFYEKSHRYKIKNQELTSVTTLCKKLFPEFDVKTISKYVAIARSKSSDAKVTARQIQKEWKETSKRATDKGTLIHEEMEKYVNDPQSFKVLREVYRPESVFGVEWLRKYVGQLSKPILIPEMLIYNEDYGLAGQVDLVISSQDEEHPLRNVLRVLDWKTNKSIDLKDKYYKKGLTPLTAHLPNTNHSKYLIQLNVYAYMLELMGYDIHSLMVVHLTAEGVVEYPISYDPVWTKLLLEEFKSGKELDC